MQSMRYLFLFSILLIGILNGLVIADESRPDVRTVVNTSLPFLWSEGQNWIDKRGCVSCHQVPFMIWSLRTAKQKDFDVDEKRLEELIAWSTKIKNFNNPKNSDQTDQTESKTAAANIDTMAQLLLAISHEDSSVSAEWRETFASYLVQEQQQDGTWRACGQLPFQKRPKQETTAVTTLWTAYALRDHKDSVKFNSELPKSLVVEDDATVPKSTEWYAIELLVAYQIGNPNRKDDLIKQLSNYQNEDGGWGWLTDAESDALGTGIALYALLKTGVSVDQPTVQDAIRFLTSTQTENGSWQVRSTKGKHQAQFTPTSIYWGTAWAVIALCETLESVD